MQAQTSVGGAIAAFRHGDLEGARRLAERELELGQQSPLLHHLLGLVECRLGNLERGIRHLRMAVDADPRNVDFRIMLARALIDSGKNREALEVAGTPGTAPPQLLEVRAEAALALGERHIEIEARKGICAARPQDPIACMNLARSLLAQQRFLEAENAYREALRLAPLHIGALNELGLTLERANKIDSLRILLEQALVAGIGKEALREPWALCELRSGNISVAAQLVRDQPVDVDSVRWNRLRARVFDAMGDASAAYDAATSMNRSVPDADSIRATGTDYRHRLRILADAITPEWSRRLPRLQNEQSPKLAFLVGFPRSGTTLVDTFLMGHPNCAVVEEEPMLLDAGAALGPVSGLDSVEVESLRKARGEYLERLASIAGGGDGLIVDKFPLNLVAAPLIHCIFPEAPFIFVQRHPCDSVLSAFMQSFQPNVGMASFLDLVEAADFYDCVMTVWEKARECLPLRVHTVVYEEVVSDPEAALRPLIKGLGLEWDDRLLDHRRTARARGPLLNTSYNQITEPLSKSASGRWHRYEEQLRPVLPILLPWAERLANIAN